MALATGTAIGLGLGAALGLGKNFQDQKNYSNQLEANKAKIKYSPWTGLSPSNVTAPNGVGDVVSGAASGAQFGSQFKDKPPTDLTKTDPTEGAPMGTGTPSYSLTGQAGNSQPYSLGVLPPGTGQAQPGSAGSLGVWGALNDPYKKDYFSQFGG
jgi:hypothetical protein